MSFLNSNNSEYLSARITNKGRKAIARGNFNISYFQIGDSEYDYNGMFTGLTGVNSHQKILTPFDYESGVKYPFNLDSSGTTTYGVPIENPNPKTDTIRNVMGPAGFVSNFKISGNTTIETLTNTIPYSQFTGGTTLTVTKLTGTTYYGCEYVTVIYDTLSGKTITGNSNSMIYKVTALSGTTGDTTQTITLDRNTQVLTGLTGNAQIICNKKEFESNSGDLLNPLDFEGQLNPWSLDVVWGEKPIGTFSGTSENISGFMGTRYVSTKEFYGYTSSGQTFVNKSGTKISGFTTSTIGAGFKNSFNELIEVSPSEQRVIAVIHYSELSDLNIDLERSFKYDDYISYKTGTTGSDASIVEDYDRENDLRDLSDSEYFEVYIPFLNYHRNTSSTKGAKFYMDIDNYFVRSTKNAYHQLLYRYLLDEVGNKVGKVFVNNKTIVFDDQELVAALDYRSNRRYTLPAPKISLVPSDGIPENSMLSDGSNMAWITYMFQYTGSNTFNSLPCNYYGKASLSVGSDGCVIATPSQVTMKFGSDTFSNMYTGFTSVTDGFVADKFYALVQLVTTGTTPTTDGWKMIELTSQIPNHVSGTTINPTNLRNTTFTIYYSGYTGSTNFFDLETHMTGVTSDYMGQPLSVTTAQFGDTQPFPGSVRLIRATDIEELNFLVNLPSTQFLSSQNPNQSGDKFITEVALLDSKKEPLVVAKTPIPIKRIGNQVFAIKLDF